MLLFSNGKFFERQNAFQGHMDCPICTGLPLISRDCSWKFRVARAFLKKVICSIDLCNRYFFGLFTFSFWAGRSILLL